MTTAELNNLYKKLYMNFYDDNELHAEYAIFNEHPETEDDYKNMIADFVKYLIENNMVTDIAEIAATIEVPVTDLDFIKI